MPTWKFELERCVGSRQCSLVVILRGTEYGQCRDRKDAFEAKINGDKRAQNGQVSTVYMAGGGGQCSTVLPDCSTYCTYTCVGSLTI